MPNGGYICCGYCVYNLGAECEVYGLEPGVHLLCRMFRLERRQSFEEISERYGLLRDLAPGIVYALDNTTFSSGGLQPAYILQHYSPGSGIPAGEERWAQETIERILPDAHVRALSLQIFAAAIKAADNARPESWRILLLPASVRLVVGGLVVCTLVHRGIWLALDAEGISQSERQVLEASGAWQWTQRWDYVDFPYLGGYYLLGGEHLDEATPVLLRHNQALIEKAAARWQALRTPSQPAHSAGALRYLRRVLDRGLPEPGFVRLPG